MTSNKIFRTTTGKDPMKFEHIEAFEKLTSNGKVKLVVSGFRNAGKIKEFIQEHAIAEYHNDYNWGRYGYQDHDHLFLLSHKDAMTVQELITGKKEKPKKTPEEKKGAWVRRLARLTGISLDDAENIATEKLEYQSSRIYDLESEQGEHYSYRLADKIRDLERQDPLRHIKDRDHAFAILAASVRHNASDYEAMLDEGRELAALGEIEYSEVKQYARTHAHYHKSVRSTFFED